MRKSTFSAEVRKRAVGMVLKHRGEHPLALLRAHLQTMRLMTAAKLQAARSTSVVKTCGILAISRRPKTAISLEWHAQLSHVQIATTLKISEVVVDH